MTTSHEVAGAADGAAWCSICGKEHNAAVACVHSAAAPAAKVGARCAGRNTTLRWPAGQSWCAPAPRPSFAVMVWVVLPVSLCHRSISGTAPVDWCNRQRGTTTASPTVASRPAGQSWCAPAPRPPPNRLGNVSPLSQSVSTLPQKTAESSRKCLAFVSRCLAFGSKKSRQNVSVLSQNVWPLSRLCLNFSATGTPFFLVGHVHCPREKACACQRLSPACRIAL